MSQARKTRAAHEPFPVRQAAVLVAVALVFRLVYWLLASKSLFLQTPVVDGSFFDIWAKSLAAGRVFQPAAFFKPPLYAYLLSWLYKVGFSLTGVLVLQMLVGSFTVLLTYLCGRLVFTARIAFTGALILAVLPILPFFETQLLAETWTTALTMGSLLLVLRMATGKTASPGRALFFAGLLMGVAALGRPNLMLLVAAVAGWLWWNGRAKNQPTVPGITMASVILLIAGFLLAVSPATIHNLKYGEFTLISANMGANLVTGNSDAADGVSALPVGVIWDDFQLQTRQEGVGRPVEASRHLTKKALSWVAANPGRTLALMGKKDLLMVNAQEGRNNINPVWFARQEGVFLLARWWPATWLVLPAAILGLTFFRRWRPGGGLLLWLVLIQAAGVLPFFVNARFRMPLLPLLALFAAAGVAVLIELWNRGDRREFFVRCGMVAALFVVVNVDWFGLGAEKWLARDWFNQGLIHSRPYGDRQPDRAQAEQSFRRALELDAGEVDFSERLGAFLLGRAQPLVQAGEAGVRSREWATASAALRRADPLLKESQSLHRRAVELYPRSFRSWINLGVSGKWLGDVQAYQISMAMAQNDTTSARQAAVGALRYYMGSVQSYQKSLEIDPGLENSKRSINQVFDSVMALPGLDPSITDFQRRASAEIRNGNQGRR